MQDSPGTETITVPADGVTIQLTPEEYEALLAQRAAEAQADAAPAITPDAQADAADIQNDLVDGAEDLTGDGSAIADLLDVDRVQTWLAQFLTWVRTDVLNINSAIQLALILGAIGPAIIFGPRLKAFIASHLRKWMPAGILRRIADAAATLATPIAAWITLSLSMAILRGAFGQPDGFLSAAQSLLTAWIVVRLVTLAIRSPFWSKVAFVVAWPIAALDAFGVLGDVFAWMDTVSFEITPETPDHAAQSLSLYGVLRAGLIFAIFLVLANFLTGLLVTRMNQTEEINASLKALIAKVMGFILPIIALVMALAVIGFDLASLAFFGGAIGIGIGLGLQKIIGNFLAGFTLLADRSIKPGDVIEIGDTFGAITDMKSRYVSIRTRDGKEHLVPNATFMDEGVINWSHNDKVVCCYASMGVGYGTKDMHKVRKLVEAAALDTPRVLARPAPKCNMTEFGDSSVNFELRFWINDPMNGVSNVRSDILFRVWEAFAENGIEIPFPQRDLHIRSSAVAFGTGYREAAE
ncbi:mechanosensitive ion channel domain-containing protein [Parvularcula dongshanensis]|uniref:Small-conductance mechanosensitive channel n=1 Tax=Parvularcula dongshanensis TaxID=1173995 RepID=A0A840I1R5_9PROT|nr:small-conductance mechanosensitive channel [Parvularcula dongshanensis]